MVIYRYEAATFERGSCESLLRLSCETPLIFRITRHRFQKDWYNTPYSCHICGRYHDRPATREEHYRSARKYLRTISPELFG
jgi:hypothetical protein